MVAQETGGTFQRDAAEGAVHNNRCPPPSLLIFDEPFSGFDPVNAELLKREILQLRDEGHTIIYSTHNMASVEDVCDDIALINKSRVVLSGSVIDVKRQFSDGTFEIKAQGTREQVESLARQLKNVEVHEVLPSMNDVFLQTITSGTNN